MAGVNLLNNFYEMTSIPLEQLKLELFKIFNWHCL